MPDQGDERFKPEHPKTGIVLPKKWEDPQQRADVDIGEFDHLGQAIFKDRFPVTYPFSGEFTGKNEGFNIHMSYTALSPDDSKPRNILELLISRSVNAQLAAFGDTQNVKSLKTFSLETNDGKASIDLNTLLPKGWRIWFIPDEEAFGGFVIPPMKTIVMPGDLTKLSSIIALFHECGHAHTIEKEGRLKTWDLMVSKLRNGIQKPSSHTLSVLLDSERNAWAYACNMLRPFIRSKAHSTLTAENVLRMVHDVALRGYNEEIFERSLPKEEAIKRHILKNVYIDKKTGEYVFPSDHAHH